MDMNAAIKRVARKYGIPMYEIAPRMKNTINGTVGVSVQALSKMINGNLSVGKLEELASIIGCDIREFFVEEQPSLPELTCPHCGKPLSVHLS